MPGGHCAHNSTLCGCFLGSWYSPPSCSLCAAALQNKPGHCSDVCCLSGTPSCLTFVSLASCQHCCQVPVRCMLSVGWQCQNGNPPLLHHSKSRVNSCTMCTEAMMKPMHAFTGIEVSVLSTKCICTCHEVSRAFCHQTCRVCLSWSG